MPQIWPMNWILLFLVFILTFLIFMTFTYFIPQTPSFKEASNSNLTSLNLNWKW